MVYHIGKHVIDPERLELSESGRMLSVQPQVFALLVFLIRNRDRVVTKDEIIEHVWEGRIVSDGTLNARINAARTALGDDGKVQAVIKTYPRRGFRLTAEVVEDTTNEHVVQVDTASTPGRPALAASLAVLPFNNLSGDPEQDYFADGITEDLITDLSKIPDLFVIARNSSFSFKGRSADIREIGDALGVRHILEGSVRKAGSRIRINSQLIDTESGGHLWAERYDSDLEDIFALQDEITAKIVGALKVNLAENRPAARQTNSVEAYELSLRGRAKFFMFSPVTNAECIQLYERAIEIDPYFSDAWAGQVMPYQSGWSFLWPGYDDGLTIAAEKAERAVELAPKSSFAQSRLGWVQTFLREPENAIASFELALELDPQNADALVFFSEALNFAGDPGRAVEVGKLALRTDPVAPPNCTFHIGHAYFLLGDLNAASETIGRAIDMAPAFPVARLIMASTLVEMGDLAAAKLQIRQLRELHPHHTVSSFNMRIPYADESHRNRVMSTLRAAGLPEE